MKSLKVKRPFDGTLIKEISLNDASDAENSLQHAHAKSYPISRHKRVANPGQTQEWKCMFRLSAEPKRWIRTCVNKAARTQRARLILGSRVPSTVKRPYREQANELLRWMGCGTAICVGVRD